MMKIEEVHVVENVSLTSRLSCPSLLVLKTNPILYNRINRLLFSCSSTSVFMEQSISSRVQEISPSKLSAEVQLHRPSLIPFLILPLHICMTPLSDFTTTILYVFVPCLWGNLHRFNNNMAATQTLRGKSITRSLMHDIQKFVLRYASEILLFSQDFF
jgi:hypothetical protein